MGARALTMSSSSRHAVGKEDVDGYPVENRSPEERNRPAQTASAIDKQAEARPGRVRYAQEPRVDSMGLSPGRKAFLRQAYTGSTSHKLRFPQENATLQVDPRATSEGEMP